MAISSTPPTTQANGPPQQAVLLPGPMPVPFGPQGAMPAIPPTIGAAHLVIAATPAEFLITFGQTRTVMTVKDGKPEASQGVEWLSTVAMSATVAQQLSEGLKEALDQYVENFGKIPRNPKAKVASSKA